ncbi:MAG: DUF3822 family protein [Bacteroidales bacterium]|nr:DUF3822 family protein [Bacteroidales bacterium]
MAFFELYDETLDINSTSNYVLSMQLGADEVAYGALDSIRNKVILVRSYEPENGKKYSIDDVKEILLNDELLARRFKSVRILLPSSKFTIVPAAIYKPERKESFFELNHQLDDDSVVLASKLSTPDAFLLFSVQRNFYDLAQLLVPGISPTHQCVPLLNNVAFNCKRYMGSYLHLHVENGYFIFIVMKESILSFCNCYHFRSTTDLLYHVLNVLNSLGINGENVLHCSGKINEFDEIYDSLSQYISSIKFVEPIGDFSYSYVFEQMNKYSYINILHFADNRREI